MGNASKQYVFLVSGKATRMPEVRGEWRMTAALSYREARSTEGTVPMLWPYMITFSGLIPYLEHHIQTDEFIHTYTLWWCCDQNTIIMNQRYRWFNRLSEPDKLGRGLCVGCSRESLNLLKHCLYTLCNLNWHAQLKCYCFYKKHRREPKFNSWY